MSEIIEPLHPATLGANPEGRKVKGVIHWVSATKGVPAEIRLYDRLVKAVRAVDPGETASVVRVPVEELADPANRFSVAHPSGYTGPAFAVSGLLVWGFTGGLLSALLDLGGWARPWDAAVVRPLDEAWSWARRVHQEVDGR